MQVSYLLLVVWFYGDLSYIFYSNHILKKKTQAVVRIYFLQIGYNRVMKIKSIITLALLFAMSFSVLHEYAFAFYDEDHCSVTEYVNELQTPSSHGDICDVHFGYHGTYILLSQWLYQLEIPRGGLFSNTNESYLSYNSSELYKPPTV